MYEQAFIHSNGVSTEWRYQTRINTQFTKHTADKSLRGKKTKNKTCVAVWSSHLFAHLMINWYCTWSNLMIFIAIFPNTIITWRIFSFVWLVSLNNVYICLVKCANEL